MKKTLFYAILSVLLIGCSPTLIPYTVGIEKRIQNKETGVQYYSGSELIFTAAYAYDSLDVNYRGEIEELRNRSSSVFRIKEHTPGILTKKEKIGATSLYWIQFDENDDRSVPFIATSNDDQGKFFLSIYVQNNNRLVQLSDKRWYRYQGIGQLMVTKKFVDQIDNQLKIAKGIKIYNK